MKKILITVIFQLFILSSLEHVLADDYIVGIGDILEVNILQPDKLTSKVTVSPSGHISVPYLGSVLAKGRSLTFLQKSIQYNLANGYLQYPVVTVALLESRSRNYTITGEIINPGRYPIGENTTVLKAISIAGGFTKFGSKSGVKILRLRKDRPGYINIKVDLMKILDGDANADVLIEQDDIIVVSEKFF